MARVTRRKVLHGSGAAALAAKAGGMAGILAAGRAPAFAQAVSVHWLKWNDFVPASDQLLRKEMLPEAEKALGIEINMETVNGNDLQPRVTAAIQAGTGPAQPRQVRHREGGAAEDRHPARTPAQGAGRTIRVPSAAVAHADEVFEEPGGGKD